MFEVSELMYTASFYDASNAKRVDDIRFYRDFCLQKGGRVLEVCCGNGRVTIPLKAAGVDISGIDRSASMIDSAKQKAAKSGLDVSFCKADLLHFQPSKLYNIVIMPFHSLQYFYSLEDEVRAFSAITSCLEPAGYFVFDVFHPKIHRIAENEGKERLLRHFTLQNHRKGNIYESLHYDRINQVLCAKWRVEQLEETQWIELDSRCYFPMEMRWLLQSNGFSIEQVYGDFHGSPLTDDSSEQVYVCRIKENQAI